eukprot:m.24552 g.24552  ORF g.24552 m.24552 type:complete len:61 (+) comp14642_c0_seq1:294-476(+)
MCTLHFPSYQVFVAIPSTSLVATCSSSVVLNSTTTSPKVEQTWDNGFSFKTNTASTFSSV